MTPARRSAPPGWPTRPTCSPTHGLNGRRDRVHDALSRLALHPDRRIAVVVYAYHFLGVTLDDIAAAIGICPRNAWRLLDLGRQWLADDLADLAQAA
jgi:DNA-directed RNA polymerase specialized sigma24 family protein